MVITSHRSSTPCAELFEFDRHRKTGSQPVESISRKAVTIMHRRTHHSALPSRVASWIRKDYPRSAPERGHCYLLALVGDDYAVR